VLTDDLRQVRRDPLPTLLVLVCGLALGFLLGLILHSGTRESATSVSDVTRKTGEAQLTEPNVSTSHSKPPAPSAKGIPAASAGTPAAFRSSETASRRAALMSLLNSGVQTADALGGRAAAAIWVHGWRQPLVVQGNTPATGRLWSMSKPVAAIAAYQAAEVLRETPSPTMVRAMTDAIRRSDNCGQRRVILGLQQLAGGLSGAEAAFHKVLAEAGANIAPTTQQGTLAQDDPECATYLRRVAPATEPNAPAWQFGTDTWSIHQAVAFAHALEAGHYGAAGEAVLRLMRAPKLGALTGIEGATGDEIPNLQWGAGTAFRGLEPAYKAGWGGSAQRNFLAGQIVVLSGANPPMALAAMFYPAREPATDNLGGTVAPIAIQRLFERVANGLQQEQALR
jgi:hypothetical protein